MRPQAQERLASLLKVVGHPVRIQIVSILANKRQASLTMFQNYIPYIDKSALYFNLSFLHEKKILKKQRKGREIYYLLTDNTINEGIAFLSLSKLVKTSAEANV
ncbi:hypothetical protein GO755_19250 [Spirosoma sp. HMF4905]|uniref:HTH arsR-type domain-containing protein n=1 Tax=Spirosoma arboris TaxID=2682092 RepID=A0A7K1SEN8_9BACT|nr:helix-turn-helix transcriptional regulator [Spirosoma arboris]MVM32193.1 hypothetical protein [Spirosoma arboris]